jgi:hypothetical protein
MSCGNNCAGCSCDEVTDTFEVSPEERIEKLEKALAEIIIASTNPDWAKSDIGRLAKNALKG